MTPSCIKNILQGLIATALLLGISEATAQSKKKRSVPSHTPAGAIILAENGVSRYRIVLPSSPTASEKKAADVLQHYLLEISGTALPIRSAIPRRGIPEAAGRQTCS